MTLPTPHPAFHWTIEPWGAALRCAPLSALAQHLFTTRQLGLRASGDPQPEAWAAVAASLGMAGAPIARVRQVHGDGVRVVGASGDAASGGEAAWRAALAERPEADALVSRAAGVVLAVQVADCVPMLLADARTGAVGAVHAGWRGTCARVAPAALEAMAREFGTRPEDVTAAIGPSIGPCCYEVGAELLQRFEAGHHAEADLARWFTRVDGKTMGTESLRLDVARANVDQMTAAGVPPARIFGCGLCTKCRHHLFDSFRADQANAGRMAAAISGQ
ncbi:MAG: peptidoglycan editing factor PgeF [Vicinamibacterales bacterium]|nr:peptidoglycan editing factor PgeF [Vicinamibacterales bacterium]